MSNIINFYYMQGCGFCSQAKDRLKDGISSGIIHIKDKSLAPAGVRGFPYFTYGDKMYEGAPPDLQTLLKEIGYTPIKENFNSDSWIAVTTTPERYTPTNKDCMGCIGVM